MEVVKWIMGRKSDLKYFSILSIIVIVFLSGCSGNNINDIVKSMPQVKQFLADHPDSTLTTIYWDTNKVSSNMNIIQSDCGEKLEVKPYYKVDVV